jgi:hypothetical protein
VQAARRSEDTACAPTRTVRTLESACDARSSAAGPPAPAASRRRASMVGTTTRVVMPWCCTRPGRAAGEKRGRKMCVPPAMVMASAELSPPTWKSGTALRYLVEES